MSYLATICQTYRLIFFFVSEGQSSLWSPQRSMRLLVQFNINQLSASIYKFIKLHIRHELLLLTVRNSFNHFGSCFVCTSFVSLLLLFCLFPVSTCLNCVCQTILFSSQHRIVLHVPAPSVILYFGCVILDLVKEEKCLVLRMAVDVY